MDVSKSRIPSQATPSFSVRNIEKTSPNYKQHTMYAKVVHKKKYPMCVTTYTQNTYLECLHLEGEGERW